MSLAWYTGSGGGLVRTTDDPADPLENMLSIPLVGGVDSKFTAATLILLNGTYQNHASRQRKVVKYLHMQVETVLLSLHHLRQEISQNPFRQIGGALLLADCDVQGINWHSGRLAFPARASTSITKSNASWIADPGWCRDGILRSRWDTRTTCICWPKRWRCIHQLIF